MRTNKIISREKNEMTDRYAKYTKFEFDRPAERVLRITI